MGTDKFAGKARKKITKKQRTMKKKRTMKKRGATKRRSTKRRTTKRRTTKRRRTKKRRATKRRQTKKQKGGGFSSDFNKNGPIRNNNPSKEAQLEDARWYVQFLKIPLVEQFDGLIQLFKSINRKDATDLISQTVFFQDNKAMFSDKAIIVIKEFDANFTSDFAMKLDNLKKLKNYNISGI
jgi:hypothetical protein